MPDNIIIMWFSYIVLDSVELRLHGPSEWGRLKHDENWRAWRKFHLSTDPARSEIVTFEVTDSDTSDSAIAGPQNRRDRPDGVAKRGQDTGEDHQVKLRSAA